MCVTMCAKMRRPPVIVKTLQRIRRKEKTPKQQKHLLQPVTHQLVHHSVKHHRQSLDHMLDPLSLVLTHQIPTVPSALVLCRTSRSQIVVCTHSVLCVCWSGPRSKQSVHYVNSHLKASSTM